MSIEYAVMGQSHRKAAAVLAAQQFAHSEPLAKHLGLSATDLIPAMEAMIEATVSSELQFVAIDDDEDEVVGCLFGKDLLEDFPDTLAHAVPALAPVFALMDEVSESYRAANAQQPKRTVAEGLVLAVRSDMRRHGVAMGFLPFGFRHWVRLGYQRGCLTLTSRATQQMCVEKLGMPILKQIKCEEFVFEGRKPFAGITSLDTVMLVGSLDPK